MSGLASSEYRASPLAIWSALLAVYLIWGSTYLSIRFTVETTPPFVSAAFRFIVSGAFLYTWRRIAGSKTHRSGMAQRRQRRNFSFGWRQRRCRLRFTVHPFESRCAVGRHGTAVDGCHRLGASEPTQTDCPGDNRYPYWLLWCGSADPVRLQRAVLFNVFGTAAVLFASLSWAIGSLYARAAKLPQCQLFATGMEMLAGGLALVLIATAVGEWHRLDINAISSRSALALAYLTAIGSAAFVAYAWLLRVAPTPLVSTYAYVNPLVAVLLGYFLADEPLSARTLFSAGLIIGSVVLVSAPKR